MVHQRLSADPTKVIRVVISVKQIVESVNLFYIFATVRDLFTVEKQNSNIAQYET